MSFITCWTLMRHLTLCRCIWGSSGLHLAAVRGSGVLVWGDTNSWRNKNMKRKHISLASVLLYGNSWRTAETVALLIQRCLICNRWKQAFESAICCSIVFLLLQGKDGHWTGLLVSLSKCISEWPMWGGGEAMYAFYLRSSRLCFTSTDTAGDVW